MNFLRAVYTFTLIAPVIIFFGTIATLAGFLRFPRSIVDECMNVFGWSIMAASRVKIDPRIAKSDPKDLPPQLVIVVNHESVLDIGVIQHGLPKRSKRFVAKQQVFYVPFLGWAMAATNNVPVRRNSTKTDLGRLKNSHARRRDNDVIFFAEGTRARDGKLKEFKKGAFHFALENNRPILPVAIGGTYDLMPSNQWYSDPGRVSMIVGEPIDPQKLGISDATILRDYVQEIVADLRKEALKAVDSPRFGD
ncbi:1-acyl-sn-glycerol-3-phosphate acyltransferase [Myxococcota bacterium]|nr:1-acyl-sn-glycerol-3-phosphate acyltransferase [Myxococcota bacterium]